MTGTVRIVPFNSEAHLAGVLGLCREEGWAGLAREPERTRASLNAPGVSCAVATCDGDVIGFAQVQGDGVLQAHLSCLVVGDRFRGGGVGKRLVEEAFSQSGCERMDLVAAEGSERFYESFPHKTAPGYRIYPR